MSMKAETSYKMVLLKQWGMLALAAIPYDKVVSTMNRMMKKPLAEIKEFISKPIEGTPGLAIRFTVDDVVSVIRREIRRRNLDIPMLAEDAWAVLDEYTVKNPDSPAAQWYLSSDESKYDYFVKMMTQYGVVRGPRWFH